jgi:heme-degrading monooxygenase HmoA
MYARSTTVRGNSQSVDDAVAYVRDEVMPAIQQMDGCIGLSLMCDRDSGRCIATTAWESEEAMHNSESGVHDMRMRMAQMMGSDSPQVQEWEIAVLHRMHNAPEGACARVIWIQGDPARMEDATSTMRTVMLSKLEELPGFCSVSMLVDRATGRGVTAAVYDSREAMARAADRAKSLREDFTREMGMEITEVAEFELALAHLRVPETV